LQTSVEILLKNAKQYITKKLLLCKVTEHNENTCNDLSTENLKGTLRDPIC